MNPQYNGLPNPAISQPPTAAPAGGVEQGTVLSAPSSVSPQGAPLPTAAIPTVPSYASPSGSAGPTQQDSITPAPLQVDEGTSDDAQDIEWVTKAKETADRTVGDPFMRSNELGSLKAQYLKSRYNKDIKLSDGS